MPFQRSLKYANEKLAETLKGRIFVKTEANNLRPEAKNHKKDGLNHDLGPIFSNLSKKFSLAT